MGIGEIIGLIVTGLIVGALGRFVIPGRNPMGMLMTIGVGIVSALVAGWLVGGGVIGFVVAIVVAAVLVVLVGRLAGGRRTHA